MPRRGNPLDFAETTIGAVRKIDGIATPVCALARNDVFSFGPIQIVYTISTKWTCIFCAGAVSYRC